MPIQIRSDIEGDVPNEPHLALLTDDTGLATAIPVGATLYIVEDASRADKVFPVVLAKVSRRAIVFVCACGEPNCNRTYRYVNNVQGWHKPKQRNTATQE